MIGYLAAEGFEEELEHELGDVVERHGRLLLSSGPLRSAAWAQNTWLEPQKLSVRSIRDASRQLRAIQRGWAGVSFRNHRRAALIQAQLPHVSAKPVAPYSALPTSPLGSWTLIDPETILCSAACTSPFPHGEPRFIEDKTGPPSRAYLKLWELFTLSRQWPQPGQRVLDLGSAPGGWTWVLAKLGCEVLSVDKAALAPEIAAMPNVQVLRESAFGLDPARIGHVDWLFSDVICYPTRLLSLVERWRKSGCADRYVCTLKFQGETDHATAGIFASIDGATLRHLAVNRHELTWTAGR